MTSAEEFTEFAAAASPRLRRTAFLLCGDWQAAEDLTQATLAKVFVAWRRISRRDAALSYATRTLAITYLAAQRRRRVSELLTSRPPGRAADPGTPELRVVVLDALATLPPKARAVVVLRYWEDLSVEQVAVLLGCSPGNVKSQSARSLDKLRALLGDAVTAADPRTPRRASGPKPETSMIDEPSLRDLLGRAAEPEPPLGPLASRALRAGVRLRRRRLALSGALSAAAAAAVSVVTATLAGAPGRPPVPVTATAEPAPGPSAGQLAHGRWVRIPPAPLKMCGNLAVWDGRALVVIQEPSGGCPLGAAAYDPRVNRWTTIAPPPLLKHQWAVAAAGGGQVLLVVTSGATCSWRPATGRWQPLGTLPAGRNYFSVAWTGTTFLVTRLCQRKTPVPAQAFKLTRGRWTPLPDLPQPATGRMAEAPRSRSTALSTWSPASR